jgi:hypothetical protein
MFKRISSLIAASVVLLVAGQPSQATTYEDRILGRVKLTPWCQKVYGKEFKARLTAKNSGGWTCEQSAGNRRGILVSEACKLQYGNRAYKAKALDLKDPYSWRCIAKVAVPTMKGVNLTAWCQKVYGSKFKAKLIGKNAGSWTCEQSAGNRRPVLVSEACKLQYGKRAYEAKALDWNDPGSWKCLLR